MILRADAKAGDMNNDRIEIEFRATEGQLGAVYMEEIFDLSAMPVGLQM